MTAEWYAERDDRSLRYAGRVLDRERWVVVRAGLPDADRYDCQVALLTAVNLLGRMTPSVGLLVPDVLVQAPLPRAGRPLREVLVEVLHGADPAARVDRHVAAAADYVLDFGACTGAHVVHGSGWSMFAGPGPSPICAVNDANPVGPSMAAILAAAQLFVRDLRAPDTAVVGNAWTWENQLAETSAPMLSGGIDLGNVWSVGVGSVGTAVLYFLALTTRSFSSALFDMDRVKVPNLDRSPIFNNDDVGAPKVSVTERFLKKAGVAKVAVDAVALDQSRVWTDRLTGTPDILVSAANERNVRHVIESVYPPVQIYGTTGRNWQATLLRHLPMRDPCTCCLFPALDAPPMTCGEAAIQAAPEHTVDASLPFLSFAAGAMAAAEILKLAVSPEACTENRVVLATNPSPRFVRAPLAYREGCACQTRDPALYKSVLAGSRHSARSGLA